MVMAAVLAATGLVRRSRWAAMLAVAVALAALAGAIGLLVAVSIVVLVAAVRRLRHARGYSRGRLDQVDLHWALSLDFVCADPTVAGRNAVVDDVEIWRKK